MGFRPARAGWRRSADRHLTVGVDVATGVQPFGAGLSDIPGAAGAAPHPTLTPRRLLVRDRGDGLVIAGAAGQGKRETALLPAWEKPCGAVNRGRCRW